VIKLVASGLIASGLIAAGLVAGSVLVAPAAGGAESDLVNRADRHGDVEVYDGAEDIDPAIVNSIDLRHVTVTRQRHGVRVVVRLKEVLPARGGWFQGVSISVSPPSWGGPSWFFAAFVTPQHLGSAGSIYAEITDEEDGPDPEEGEAFCRVDATKGAKVVRLSIPDRCLPKAPGELIVSSDLVGKRGDNPLIAEDHATVRVVDLQPGR
jgi:hypothetical protein